MKSRNSLEHLLVPVDFSDVTRELVNAAANIANYYGSRITLLHVIEESIVLHVAGGYDVTGLIKNLESKARKSLEEIRDAMERKGIEVKIYPEMPIGNPGVVIADVAVEIGASEILIATKGLGLSRIIPAGTTLKEAVKLTRVPIIRIKAFKENGQARVVAGMPMFRKVLLGVDRNVSRDMVDYAFSLASKDEGKVVAVHVIEPPAVEPSYEIKNILKYCEKLSSEAGVELEAVIARGKPDKLLREILDQMGATSIIVGRTVERRISELILGSTLDRLIGIIDKPLIVYPL